MSLTRRETDVLQLLAKGCTYADVSEALGVSENTVASHVKKIYRKLGVHSASAAVWRAVELQILVMPNAVERSAPHLSDVPNTLDSSSVLSGGLQGHGAEDDETS